MIIVNNISIDNIIRFSYTIHTVILLLTQLNRFCFSSANVNEDKTKKKNPLNNIITRIQIRLLFVQ